MLETKSKGRVPEHEIEALARCLLPDLLAFFESEEGKSEYEKWKENNHSA